ncbi:hypothetical protein WUBG_06459 [Wuchereria bancrofti]|uniref:Uncharacterized protein n=1 Tax=Wuchereria bancrofti TaxID=6293 RepID=J9B6I2_WUCBA|nr:hypothetical protein WUBG_06459 [Wuchereria bancrofti]
MEQFKISAINMFTLLVFVSFLAHFVVTIRNTTNLAIISSYDNNNQKIMITVERSNINATIPVPVIIIIILDGALPRLCGKTTTIISTGSTDMLHSAYEEPSPVIHNILPEYNTVLPLHNNG